MTAVLPLLPPGTVPATSRGMEHVSRYFASGSNRIGEIRGLAAAGRNIGVAAPEVSPRAEAALAALAGSGLKVFVDSGAFGEVSFEGGWHIVREITDAEWELRLDLYVRLARVLGSQLYAVAPDCVGNQELTLARLARYADRVREIAALGANVIVAVQKGRASQADFLASARAILGDVDLVVGVPSKKGATTLDELRELGAALPAGTRVHLLGKGVHSRDFDAYAEAIEHCVVFSDSVRICAMVGRGGRRPRRLTAQADAVRAEAGLAERGRLTEALYTEAVRRAFVLDNSDLGFVPSDAENTAAA